MMAVRPALSLYSTSACRGEWQKQIRRNENPGHGCAKSRARPIEKGALRRIVTGRRLDEVGVEQQLDDVDAPLLRGDHQRRAAEAVGLVHHDALHPRGVRAERAAAGEVQNALDRRRVALARGHHERRAPCQNEPHEEAIRGNTVSTNRI